jgi:hypothetical protein
MALTNGLRYCSVLLLTGILFGCDNGDFYILVKEEKVHKDYISKYYMDEDEGFELKEVTSEDLSINGLWLWDSEFNYFNIQLENITFYDNDGKLINNKTYEGAFNAEVALMPEFGAVKDAMEELGWRCSIPIQNGKAEGIVFIYSSEILTGNNKLSKNLKLVSEYTYHRGKLHGKFKEYYSDGQIKLQGQYYFGKRTGIELRYSEDGRVSSSVDYVAGHKKDAKTYFENGRLKKHSKYHDNFEIWYQQYNSAGKLIIECDAVSLFSRAFSIVTDTVSTLEDMSRQEIHYKLYDPNTKRYRKVNWTRDGVFDDLFFYYNEEGEFVCTIKNAINPGDREIIEFSNGTVLSFIPTQDSYTEVNDPMLELPRGKYTYRLSTQEIQCFENSRLVGTYNLKSKQVNGTIQLAGLLKPIANSSWRYENYQENGLWDYCKEINEIEPINQVGLEGYFKSLEEFSKKIPKAVY